jgi:hypothetical protein
VAVYGEAVKASRSVALVLALAGPASLHCVEGGDGSAASSERTGLFVSGDGIGRITELRIEPQNHFELTVGSDIGRMGSAEGRVLRDGPWLELKPEVVEGDGSDTVGQRLLSVEWGERCYLVPERKILRFVNYVNRGSEPRDTETGTFLFRTGDSRRSAVGLPKLPRPWSKMLLEAPVTGHIVGILGEERARVDVGSGSGLHAGMELLVEVRPGEWCRVVLEQVDVGSAVVSVVGGGGPLLMGLPVTSRWR